MRFDCYRDFVALLRVFQTFGYEIPFKDYEEDMREKGLTKHIHCYSFGIIITEKCIILASKNLGSSYTLTFYKSNYNETN